MILQYTHLNSNTFLTSFPLIIAAFKNCLLIFTLVALLKFGHCLFDQFISFGNNLRSTTSQKYSIQLFPNPNIFTKMPEKTQKRKLRSDQSTSQIDEEIASSTNDANVLLSDRDFEDISSKVENRLSKRLRDTEVNQREILKLIENLSSKVDNLTSVNLEQNFSTPRTEIEGNPTYELEEVELARSVNSNINKSRRIPLLNILAICDIFRKEKKIKKMFCAF